MQTIDYSEYLDPRAARAFVSPDVTLDEEVYGGDEGIQFRSVGSRRLWECVRLMDSAFLLASRDPAGDVLNYRQCVSGSDWVHIQFRLSGGGSENLSGTGIVQTPERSCVVSRYPESCVLERTVDTRRGWKVACLYAKPAALSHLLDVPAARLPEDTRWLAQDEYAQPRAIVLPLQSSMVFAVNDILSCPCRGGNRRAYMRGKALDLLATVIHALSGVRSTGLPVSRLLAGDMERIALARSIMCAHLESTLTLGELARKVGINRTKLAEGFKSAYGVSVQAFWRDAKLDHARLVLRDGYTPVTKVAFSIGYSELSSFTRAFVRRFGIAPRECMMEGRR
jgi:AraC family transcriptional regulator, transcriptional activator of the genes for pyochelin and ferripyochelin receptors